MNELELSVAIEKLLLARNLRGMQIARDALQPGYYLRAAAYLRDLTGTVLIGTGFPVSGTFETDGPVGAIALYDALEALGANPILACGAPLCQILADDYEVLRLKAKALPVARKEAVARLRELAPQAVISIERPGLTADGRYYNMRGEDITDNCAYFDPYVTEATCPTIAVGDGGNEIGMGNIAAAIASLDITAATTGCDELLVADVSNWGAYGLIALLAMWARRDLLAAVSPVDVLAYLSAHGSVDGVTRENTPTEDGLEAGEGLQVIRDLRILTGFLPAPGD